MSITMLIEVIVTILLCQTSIAVVGQEFGYNGHKGPMYWSEQYQTCSGKHQSPIDINSLDVKRVILPPLKLNGFGVPPVKMSIKNNGHTVMVTMDSEVQPSVSGGPLAGVYEFAQLHFHWGDNDTFGSEDHIDSRSYPMELHMVFYKKAYRNARSAMEYSDGLCVMAFFYEISEIDNPAYAEFTSLLHNITAANQEAEFEHPISIDDLVVGDLTRYYTYNGSLTTPPCSEIVTWIDFTESIPLSHQQIQMFRLLENSEGEPLTHNFRPIQPIGDRIVEFHDGDDFIDHSDNFVHPVVPDTHFYETGDTTELPEEQPIDVMIIPKDVDLTKEIPNVKPDNDLNDEITITEPTSISHTEGTSHQKSDGKSDASQTQSLSNVLTLFSLLLVGSTFAHL